MNLMQMPGSGCQVGRCNTFQLLGSAEGEDYRGARESGHAAGRVIAVRMVKTSNLREGLLGFGLTVLVP